MRCWIKIHSYFYHCKSKAKSWVSFLTLQWNYCVFMLEFSHFSLGSAWAFFLSVEYQMSLMLHSSRKLNPDFQTSKVTKAEASMGKLTLRSLATTVQLQRSWKLCTHIYRQNFPFPINLSSSLIVTPLIMYWSLPLSVRTLHKVYCDL